MNVAYNMDCMEYMRTLQDKAFDLAVVDPPYFSGPERRGYYGCKISPIGVKRDYPVSPKWDIPDAEFFAECGMQRRVRMIEYIRVVSKQRPAKRAFDMQVGAHLRVYIAGKITGDKNYREKFAKAEQALTAMGHCVLNPANLPSGMEQGDYMRICFSMIDCADCVVLLPDWRESDGARLERAYAEKIGKEVVVADQGRIDEFLEKMRR